MKVVWTIARLLLVCWWMAGLFSPSPSHAQSLPFTPTPEPTEQPIPTAVPPTAPPVVIVATPTTLPATATPSPTALPPGFGRDACDPNHTLQQPCAVPTETDIAALSFTDASVDVFSFLLKGNRQYRIAASVGATGGLDPSIQVYPAGSETVVATNDDEVLGNASAAVTVTVQVDGWYLVQVTNTAPGNPEGKTYTLSARTIGTAAAQTPPAVSNPDDVIGNAYSPDRAARMAWNVPYDLSMQCPDSRPNACYAGRHAFLLVPVKQGIPFVALTYDLGAGVDTVLTLYQPDPTQTQEGNGLVPGWRVIAANDDIAPGWTLRSQLGVVPAWSGAALLVVAPSSREDLPPIPVDGRPGRYRLILGSPELSNVRAALAGAASDLPPTPVPPTPRPTGQPAPAAVAAPATTPQDNREVIKESCPQGTAVISVESTGLYAAAPPGGDDRIAGYPAGALVQLLGQCYRGWVKVQPDDSVTPGWMWGPNLRPETLDQVPGTPVATILPGMPTATARAGQFPFGTPSVLPVGSPVPTESSGTIVLQPLSAPVLTTLEPVRPVARVVTVEVCRAATTGTGCGKPLRGVRVALATSAQQRMLVNDVTDARGTVTLSVSVPDGTQLVLLLPTIGIAAPLDGVTTTVPVRISEGGRNDAR